MKAAGAFVFLQKVGKALMLPVAVLPVAGLLLGIGAAPFDWMPPVVTLQSTETAKFVGAPA